jgi:hypothetical protein
MGTDVGVTLLTRSLALEDPKTGTHSASGPDDIQAKAPELVEMRKNKKSKGNCNLTQQHKQYCINSKMCPVVLAEIFLSSSKFL